MQERKKFVQLLLSLFFLSFLSSSAFLLLNKSFFGLSRAFSHKYSEDTATKAVCSLHLFVFHRLSSTPSLLFLHTRPSSCRLIASLFFVCFSLPFISPRPFFLHADIVRHLSLLLLLQRPSSTLSSIPAFPPLLPSSRPPSSRLPTSLPHHLHCVSSCST